MTTRRTFIAAAAAGAASSAGAATPVNNYPKLVHHVFFWLKNPNSKEDLNKLIEGLQTLRKIESVKKLHIVNGHVCCCM